MVANWVIKIRTEMLQTTGAIVVAAAIAAGAYMLHLLTRNGAIAAAVVGVAAVLAGHDWVVVLLFFFVSSSVLSRWRRAERDQLVGSIPEKGDVRDAMQVVANGGVFAVAAFFAGFADPVPWQAVGAGAIAAATSDTWSTEIGTVLGDEPRSIWSGDAVLSGTSGGITIAGCSAAYAGALTVAWIVVAFQWHTPWHAVFVGGLAGSALDSLLGATLQERRWCPTCNKGTERRIHVCGTRSVDRGGVSGCTNDVVNLISTLAGAVVTWILA